MGVDSSSNGFRGDVPGKALQQASRLTRHAAVALAAATLSGCGDVPPPEEALRSWVAAAESAAEDKDHGALLELVSPDYADARGNDRDSIGRMLRYWFLRQKRIALLVDIDDVEVMQDTAAQLALRVGMAATNNRALGFSADAYRFELDLARRDGDWQLIAARWGELGAELE